MLPVKRHAPFEHADQQKTRSTKVKEKKERERDDRLEMREQLREYNSAGWKVSQ